MCIRDRNGVDLVEDDVVFWCQEHVDAGEALAVQRPVDLRGRILYACLRVRVDAGGHVDSGVLLGLFFFVVEEPGVQLHFIYPAQGQVLVA